MTLRRLLSDCRGGFLAEYAIVLPLFLVLVIAIMQVGHMLWVQTALQHAVDMAARCASVNAVSCATPTQIQAYAATQAYGVTVPANTFTASTQPCGNQVVAAYNFTVQTGLLPLNAVSLSAQACYPL